MYLWVVDFWSVFVSLSALRGLRSPIHPSLCLSVSQKAGVPGLHEKWGWVGGAELTWPEACHHTARGNKEDMTAWWHLLLCIISSYQSSAFHFCATPTQRVSTVGLVGLEWSWLCKMQLMKPSCPWPAEYSSTRNESGEAALLEYVSCSKLGDKCDLISPDALCCR